MVLAGETKLARFTTSPEVKMKGAVTVTGLVTGLALSGATFT